MQCMLVPTLTAERHQGGVKTKESSIFPHKSQAARDSLTEFQDWPTQTTLVLLGKKAHYRS